MLFLAKFISIYSGISDFIVLYKVKQYTSAALVFRSVLESYADLVNIVKIPGYMDRAFLTYDSSLLKTLSAIEDDPGKLEDKIINERDRLRKSIELHKSNGVKILNVREKFSLASILDHYSLSYSILSALAHNDFYAIVKGCDNVDCPILDVHHHRSIDHKMNRKCIESIVDILYLSAKLMSEYIGKFDEDALNQFKIEWLYIQDILSKPEITFCPLPES